MKKYITKEHVKRQFKVALLITIAALLDGFVMINSFDPFMVFLEILLVACATLQWSIHSQMRMFLKYQEQEQEQEQSIDL